MTLWVLVGLFLPLLRLHFASGAVTNSTTNLPTQNNNVSTASWEGSAAAAPTTDFQGIQPNGSNPNPPPPPPGCHGHSLSCGAIAGIVIAAIVFVIIIIIVVIIVIRLVMKKKQGGAESAENGTSGSPQGGNATVNHSKNADKSTKRNGEIDSTKMTDRPMSSKPKARDQQSKDGSAVPPAQFPEVKTRRTTLPPLGTSTSQPKEVAQSETNKEESKQHRRRRNSVTDDAQSPIKMSTSASRELPPLSTASSLVAGNESPEKARRHKHHDDDDF